MQKEKNFQDALHESLIILITTKLEHIIYLKFSRKIERVHCVCRLYTHDVYKTSVSNVHINIYTFNRF